MTAAVVILLVAVGLLAVLVGALIRNQSELTRTLADLRAGIDLQGGAPPGPPVPPRASLLGRAAPVLAGLDPDGRPVDRSWRDEDRGVLAFLTGGCSTCQPFWTALGDPATPATVAGLPVLVVTPSPSTESRRGMAARAVDGIRIMMSSEAWTTYGVRGAPWFVVVRGGTVRAEAHATTWAELDALVTAERDGPQEA